MWDNQEIRTIEYRKMRKTVDDRISKTAAKTIVRNCSASVSGLM